MELLSKSTNMNLRLLSVRLSFNNFYSIAWPSEKYEVESLISIDSDPHYESPITNESRINTLMQLKQSLASSLQTHSFNSADISVSHRETSSIASKCDSLTSLLDNKKKKRKHIWCCVGWKVNSLLIVIYIFWKFVCHTTIMLLMLLNKKIKLPVKTQNKF